MNETVCQFGPDQGLTGILTQPSDSVRVTDAPVALIFNAGIVHNIGPFRLHVDIARMLAAAGFSSLRIDVSGLGDSKTRTGKFVGKNRAIQDAVDAMDYSGRTPRSRSICCRWFVQRRVQCSSGCDHGPTSGRDSAVRRNCFSNAWFLLPALRSCHQSAILAKRNQEADDRRVSGG